MVRCGICHTCTEPREKPVQIAKGTRSAMAASFPGGPAVQIREITGVMNVHAGCVPSGALRL